MANGLELLQNMHLIPVGILCFSASGHGHDKYWLISMHAINYLRPLPMLRLFSSEAQGPWGRKDFWKPSKPCHVSIHWNYLLPSILRWVPKCHGFNYFSGLLPLFVLAKLATSSVRDNCSNYLRPSLLPLDHR